MGQFSDRLKQLEQEVGGGTLEGSVVVDQIYAKYQHEDLSLRHPGGGGAKYLERPLYSEHPAYLQRLADRTLDGDLNQAMADNMEDLSREVYDAAPLEFGDLKASGHPIVKSEGQVVYDRAPLAHRLNEEEIDIKEDLRRLGLGNIPASDGFGGLD
jgi:hypothetical protein